VVPLLGDPQQPLVVGKLPEALTRHILFDLDPAADKLGLGEVLKLLFGDIERAGDLDVAFERVLAVRAKIGQVNDKGRELLVLLGLNGDGKICKLEAEAAED